MGQPFLPAKPLAASCDSTPRREAIAFTFCQRQQSPAYLTSLLSLPFWQWPDLTEKGSKTSFPSCQPFSVCGFHTSSISTKHTSFQIQVKDLVNQKLSRTSTATCALSRPTGNPTPHPTVRTSASPVKQFNVQNTVIPLTWTAIQSYHRN